MKSNGKIRLARDTDITSILDIYKPYIERTAITFETEVPTLEEFQARFNDYTSKFPWLVYTLEDQVVGYAYASPHRSRCAYDWSVESSVYVRTGFHGRKIGTSLYRCLFDLIKEQGVVNVLGGITLPNNASVGLHEKLGFLPIGIYKDIGFKLGGWREVGWWQLQLQKPKQPAKLLPPPQDFELTF